MPEAKWEVSSQDTVTLKTGWTGRKQLLLNDRLVEKFSKAKSQPFPLSDGRKAQVTAPNGLTTVAPELRVDGELAHPTVPGQERRCTQCEAVARPYDKFCESCGATLPSAESHHVDANVKAASSGIGAIAVLFVISGLLMAGLQYGQAQDVLRDLAQYDASAQWSVPVNGKTITVGELREVVAWEPMATLLLNLILAAIMTGLYFWGKRSPLPAILVAAGTYAAVLVLNAIAYPQSLGQGIFVKIIIIVMLVRGIKAGFQQRALVQ